MSYKNNTSYTVPLNNNVNDIELIRLQTLLDRSTERVRIMRLYNDAGESSDIVKMIDQEMKVIFSIKDQKSEVKFKQTMANLSKPK